MNNVLPFDKHEPKSVPIGPFREWLRAHWERLLAEEIIAGPVKGPPAPNRASGRLCALAHLKPHQLHRYLHSATQQTVSIDTVDRAIIELGKAADLYELYPELIPERKEAA